MRWRRRKSVINENHYKAIFKIERKIFYVAVKGNNSGRKWLQSSLFMHNWAEREKSWKLSEKERDVANMTVLERGEMEIIKINFFRSFRMFIAYLSFYSAKSARNSFFARSRRWRYALKISLLHSFLIECFYLILKKKRSESLELERQTFC